MTMFICSFSAGLDDMKRKEQADVVAVLRVLQQAGRFSIFEATANQTIARTITRLCNKACSIVRDGVRADYGKLIDTDNSCGFPWTKVSLTDGGIRLLADEDAIRARTDTA